MPEYWGYVQISDKIAGEGETPFVKHPSEETKWILRNLYYRQNEFAATFGHYADNINDLKANELCPQEIANQLEIRHLLCTRYRYPHRTVRYGISGKTVWYGLKRNNTIY